MKRLALFASGSGSNAENIVHFFRNRHDVEVALIISNKANAFIHERARNLGIPSFTIAKDSFNKGDEVLELLQQYKVDFIVLAGFLLKVSQPLLEAFPSRIINIHPALLPKYGGKGMYGDRVHQAVVDAGDRESGITIHYINEEYDEGDIIFQATCEVLEEDTADSVARKVHALEYLHFPMVIDSLLKKIDKEKEQFNK